MANTLWCGTDNDKLYLLSEFTSTIKDSLDVSASTADVRGIADDYGDTLWSGKTPHKLFLMSGQFTSTIKTSQLVTSWEGTSPEGISSDPDGNITWGGYDGGAVAGALFLMSGKFSSTIKTSYGVGSVDIYLRSCSYIRGDTAWAGSSTDKLYIQKGQITSTMLTSVSVGGWNGLPNGVSFDGTNTLWCGSFTTDDKLYKLSGFFSSTLKDSLDVAAIDNPWGIDTVNLNGRYGLIKDSEFKWNIYAELNKDLQLEWNIYQSFAGKAIEFRWNIQNSLGKGLTLKWNIFNQADPNLEFKFPVISPSDAVNVYHGTSNNVDNRRIIRTVRKNISAGGVYNRRNVGYSDELTRVDIVLMTKEEAEELTDFCINIIKGQMNLFYFKDNVLGREFSARLLQSSMPMGQAEGHPYSVSLLLRKESAAVSTGVEFVGGRFGAWSMVISDGMLYSTGENSGQLGLGDFIDRDVFEQVGLQADWSSGSGGQFHSMVINTSGELFACGEGSVGRLGLGDYNDTTALVQLGSDTDWSVVSCGQAFTAAIKTDGTLWAWGDNYYGNLGKGDYGDDSNVPLQVGVATNWVDVKCGAAYMIVKNSLGELWACGQDDSGQLGQGSTTTRRTSLVQIGSDTDWDVFDAGSSHTMAITTTGTLWAWGNNFFGQLGDGTTTLRASPVQIGSDTWSYVATGSTTVIGNGVTSAIKSDGTLWVWGQNSLYQLGIGVQDSDPHSTPILLSSELWDSVLCCGSHAIALRSDFDVYGWGWNNLGALGQGHTNPVSVPSSITL